MGRIFSFLMIFLGLILTAIGLYLGYETIWPVLSSEYFSFDLLFLALVSGYYIMILLGGGILFLFMGFVVYILCDIRSNTRVRK